MTDMNDEQHSDFSGSHEASDDESDSGSSSGDSSSDSSDSASSIDEEATQQAILFAQAQVSVVIMLGSTIDGLSSID